MAVDFELKDRYTINDLISIVKVLRAPNGCPWDRAQTHESIKKNFIEETYEVVEAINQNSTSGLKEELGDILLQVALHAEMESEKGSFTFDDVANDIVQKLVFRHPHIFGDVVATNEKEALDSWDSAKQKEKSIHSTTQAMQRIPLELPALMRAQKVQHKASKVGFDWQSVDGAFSKLYEEIDELKIAMSHKNQDEIEDEFGDLLFSCVNVSRFLNLDSEEALSTATQKFMARFAQVERLATEKGIELKNTPLDELDKLWEEAKKYKMPNGQ